MTPSPHHRLRAGVPGGVHGLAAALLLAAAPAVAQSGGNPAPQRSQPADPAAPKRPAPAKARPTAEPLSEEDAALVKEMALLERVDLLRNLDLFERGDSDEREPAAESPKRQP